MYAKAVVTCKRSRQAKLIAVLAVCLIVTYTAGCESNHAGLSAEEKRMVAGTVRTFTEALGAGTASAADGYWSRTCPAAEIAKTAQAASLYATLIGVKGEATYRAKVDPGRLEIDFMDKDHVVIPVDQPKGAISPEVEANGQSVPVYSLPFEIPLSLVRENGTWRVASCVPFEND